MVDERYLLVIPELEQRHSLLDALRYAYPGCRLISAPSSKRAKELIAINEELSAIFVDSSYEEESFAHFVEDLRLSELSRAAPLIVLSDEQAKSRQEIVARMIVGAHPFLSRPYNAEKIQEAVSMGRKIKQQGSLPRLKAAAGLMLHEAIAGKPAAGERSAQPRDPLEVWSEVKASYVEFKRLTGQSLTLPVVHALQNATPYQRTQRLKQVRTWLHSVVRGSGI